MGMRLDFTGVESMKADFDLLPNGKYIVEVTDYREGTASERAKNAGAKTISWEMTIESTLSGEDTVTSRKGETVKVEGRKVWENMTIVEASFWRLKSFLEACGFDVEGEIDFEPDEVLNSKLVVRVGTQPSRKDKETGEEYDARNVVKGFFALDDGASE